MSEIAELYKAAAIWTMESPRETCVVPETPLFITEQEERELGRLAMGVWRAVENVTDMVNTNAQEPWSSLGRKVSVYPNGATMPPAIRVDTILSNGGPKIVEIDPVSAISLGETISLIDVWQANGYLVPDGLLESIARASGGELSLTIPREKIQYSAELGYLTQRLKEVGVVMTEGARELSSFSDVPARSRAINRDGWQGSQNPLWGSLADLANKDNLELLQAGDKLLLPRYLPKQYDKVSVQALDPETLVVAKPRKGTGSVGVGAVRVAQIALLPQETIYQELLQPRVDDFGLGEPYVSRVSVYAGAKGLLGAQVTARPLLDGAQFTNVHGQADAVQTTIAIR